MTEPTDVIDFDAFRAERTGATLTVKVRGVLYQVPASPPADAVMDAVRRRRSGITKIDSGGILELAEAILGDACEPIMRATHMQVPELMELVALVAQRQADAITPPPNRQARRTKGPRQSRSTSSPRGRRSRPTSSASTRSTSGRS